MIRIATRQDEERIWRAPASSDRISQDLGAHVANAGFRVAPEFRGLGVGRKMGEHCLAEAQMASRKGKQKAGSGFSAEERAAMRERARELKAQASGKQDGEAEVLARIAQMPAPDQAIARRLHAIVRDCAPQLVPKTWYGMPAYALDGSVVCFFQSAHKFKARYATLGFSDKAKLDEGAMWPTSYALMRLAAEEERRIRELLLRSLSGAPGS